MATAKAPLKGGEFLFADTSPETCFIPEDFDDELKLIAQTTLEYVENEVRPALDRLEKLEPGLSDALMRKAGELGLLAIEIPEAYGGAGLSKAAATVVAEYCAGSAGFNTTISAHSTIGTLPLVYFGTPEQKARYLPKLGSGEWIGAYALTEPEAGSDALGGRTAATLSEDGKHYILNGSKMWISNAGFASLFTVFAKIDGEREKFTAFLVEHDWPGVSTGAEEKKMGIKSSSTRQVLFDNVEVPVENMLGEIGQGAKIALNILNIGRFKLGASCVGSTKRIMQIAANYAQERHQFGMPIANFGMIREKLAVMALRSFAVESAVYRTIGLIDSMIGGETSEAHHLKSMEEYAVECSFIKVLGSELLDYAADEGVQIHGGYGYSADYEIEKIFRDSRINRIYEGTNEINRLLMPGMILKRAAGGSLPLMNLTFEVGNGATHTAGVLAGAETRLANLKKLTLFVMATAAKRFERKIEREQEILARLADLMMHIYASESALLRTRKLQNRGQDTTLMQAMTEAYVAKTAAHCTDWAREAMLHCTADRGALALLQKLITACEQAPVDTIALRKQIAAAVLSAGGYPVKS